jgi:hypothetical protein
MNTQVHMSAAAGLSVRTDSTAAEPSVLMTCEVCDLVGGPFSAAEAAHLRAVHDRLHHGITMAA